MAVPAAQVVRMTVAKQRLEESRKKDLQEKKVMYRISGRQKWAMLITAVFFDFLPLLLMVVAFSFIVSAAAGLNEADIARIVACSEAKASSGSWVNAKCATASWSFAKVGLAVGVAGISTVALGPLIYLIGSFFATLISFLVFLVWFLIKGVFVFALTPRRVAANLTVFIIESLPIVNILPGHTMGVAMHIRQTRIEDERKNKGAGTLVA